MAGVMGASSTAAITPSLSLHPSPRTFAKTPSVSHLNLCSILLLLLIDVGLSSGRKFYGGVAVPLKKGLSHFHFSISNVATSPAQQEVLILGVYCESVT